MYTVISYNNSRSNGTVKFLEVFSSCVKAIRCARKYANFEYGEQNVTDRVSQKLVDIKDILIQFASSDGLEMDVFAVVTLPTSKDEDDIVSVCSCDEIIQDQEKVSLFHKNMCRRRSSVDRKLFIHHDTFVNTTTKEHFHVYISDEDVDSQADTDGESEIHSEIEVDTDSETETDTGNAKDDELMGLDFDDIYYDFDDGYDEIYDDRYDEREDYGYDGGYEDECFECLDM